MFSWQGPRRVYWCCTHVRVPRDHHGARLRHSTVQTRLCEHRGRAPRCSSAGLLVCGRAPLGSSAHTILIFKHHAVRVGRRCADEHPGARLHTRTHTNTVFVVWYMTVQASKFNFPVRRGVLDAYPGARSLALLVYCFSACEF